MPLPTAVRMKIWQANRFERRTEDAPDRGSRAPVCPLQSLCFKLARCPQYDPRCRKQWIVITPQLLFPKKPHPLRHNLPDLFAHREEECVEGLAEFCLHLARILVDATFYQVHMLHLHGSDGRVPCAGQQRKRHQSAVTPLNLTPGWHHPNDVLDLLQRRGFPLALRRGDARVLLRQVEVVCIGILEPRLVADVNFQRTKRLRRSRRSLRIPHDWTPRLIGVISTPMIMVHYCGPRMRAFLLAPPQASGRD